MKLDEDSMNKLFDLMMMMFKYQLVAATGPREVVLITLNHVDALRQMITLSNGHESITLVHQMVVDVSFCLSMCGFGCSVRYVLSCWQHTN